MGNPTMKSPQETNDVDGTNLTCVMMPSTSNYVLKRIIRSVFQSDPNPNLPHMDVSRGAFILAIGESPSRGMKFRLWMPEPVLFSSICRLNTSHNNPNMSIAISMFCKNLATTMKLLDMSNQESSNNQRLRYAGRNSGYLHYLCTMMTKMSDDDLAKFMETYVDKGGDLAHDELLRNLPCLDPSLFVDDVLSLGGSTTSFVCSIWDKDLVRRDALPTPKTVFLLFEHAESVINMKHKKIKCRLATQDYIEVIVQSYDEGYTPKSWIRLSSNGNITLSGNPSRLTSVVQAFKELVDDVIQSDLMGFLGTFRVKN
eukprot:GDKJ01002880.1.p2 GENE.GDKJ01002880.1~~GDKJ01002880.1.p2  ORF type:complete len:313 (-),score=15.90 GDKJ01002880.1:1953-2891(-)